MSDSHDERKPEFHFYVMGDDERTLSLAREILDLLSDRYSGEIIFKNKNVFESTNAQDAIADGIFAIPTLLRVSPPPLKRIVGDMNHKDAVMLLLSPSSGDDH